MGSTFIDLCRASAASSTFLLPSVGFAIGTRLALLIFFVLFSSIAVSIDFETLSMRKQASWAVLEVSKRSGSSLAFLRVFSLWTGVALRFRCADGGCDGRETLGSKRTDDMGDEGGEESGDDRLWKLFDEDASRGLVSWKSGCMRCKWTGKQKKIA